MTKQNRRSFFKRFGMGFLSVSVLDEMALFSRIKEMFKRPSVENRVFFTTGFKISEVTTDTAVIWTRLCSQKNPNPVVHERKDSVFRHPIDFDEKQLVETMDGAVRSGPGVARVRVFNEEENIVSDWSEAVADNDFTLSFVIDGLKKGRHYQVELEGKAAPDGRSTIERGAFSAAPDSVREHPVLLVTSTCQYFWSFDDGKRGFRTYDSMAKMKPDFFIQTGDYVYYDKPGPLAKNSVSASVCGS